MAPRTGHLSAPLRRDGALPSEIVSRLLERLLYGAGLELDGLNLKTHEVGFFTATGQAGLSVELLYTAAIPWCLDAPPGEGWRALPLGAQAPGATGRRAIAVREAWHRLAQETTDALALLPQHFTIPEMQDVYRAIWGLRDLPNFHRWVLGNNEGMVAEVATSEREAAEREAQRRASAAAAAGAMVGGAGAAAAFGLASLVPAPGVRVGMAAGPLAPLALVAAGSTLAYRNYLRRRPTDAQERGRPPKYYKRGRLDMLRASFGSRPVWEQPLDEALLQALGGRRNISSHMILGPDRVAVQWRDSQKVDRGAAEGLGITFEAQLGQTVLVFESDVAHFSETFDAML